MPGSSFRAWLMIAALLAAVAAAANSAAIISHARNELPGMRSLSD